MADRSRLEVQEEGLAVLRGIRGSVCPVAVIGPYRSGKVRAAGPQQPLHPRRALPASRRRRAPLPLMRAATRPPPPQSFTLNQLMGVGCDVGFGVGHTRLTQTKGVWLWGEPVPVTLPGGETTNVRGCSSRGCRPGSRQEQACKSVCAVASAAACKPRSPHRHRRPPLRSEPQLLFIDTEGFESTGKADVYDDRVFALAALMSQVRAGPDRRGGACGGYSRAGVCGSVFALVSQVRAGPFFLLGGPASSGTTAVTHALEPRPHRPARQSLS